MFLRLFFRSNSVEPSVCKPKVRGSPYIVVFMAFFNEKTMKTYQRNRPLKDSASLIAVLIDRKRTGRG